MAELSPDRLGKFTASGVFRLLANGVVDWTPEREGAKGAGYTCWVAGKQYWDSVFATAAEYYAAVKAERARLGERTLSFGAMTYAEEKAMQILFADYQEHEPDLVSRDTQRGHEREPVAIALLAMAFEDDITHHAPQQFINRGDWGATPDFRVGGRQTGDVKAPRRINHLSNLLRVRDNATLATEHPDYYAQQQCQIAAAEQDYGWWCSYNPMAHNPAARLHVVRIDRDQPFINRMLAKIALAAEYRDSIIDKIRGLK